MNIKQMKYVIEIGKYMSINKAAQNLFVSQSGISTAIAELENELQISIFMRNNRGVVFTPEGKEFLEHAKKLVGDFEQIGELYANKSKNMTSFLSISSQRFPFAEDAFIKFLQDQGMNFQAKLVETDLDMVLKNVSENYSDLGVIMISPTNEFLVKKLLRSYELDFEEIVKLKPGAFMRKDHPLAKKEKVNIQDLQEYPYLVFENTRTLELTEEVYRLMQSGRIISVSDRGTALNILSNTNGVTTGSGLLSEKMTEIISIPLETEDWVNIGWVKAKSKELTRVIESYIKELSLQILKAKEYTENQRTTI